MDLFGEDSYIDDWVFTPRAWDITHVFLDGISLHGHDHTTRYYEAIKNAYSKKHTRVREYEYDARPWLPIRTTKFNHLLATKKINLIASRNYCRMNYLQLFPRPKIVVLRNQM
jgi:hypothetical protein